MAYETTLKTNEIHESEILKRLFPSLIPAPPESALHFAIRNADGGIRWIFPATATYPGFLSLYNPNTLVARLRKILIKSIFLTKTQYLAFDRIWLGTLAPGIQRVLNDKGANSFSIFMGTQGLDRKVVLEGSCGGKTIFFLKIPISKISKDLIANEFRFLATLQSGRFSGLVIPEAESVPDLEALVVSNIWQKGSKCATTFGESHFRALSELAGFSRDIHDAAKLVQGVPEIGEVDISRVNNGLDPVMLREMALDLFELRRRLLVRAAPIHTSISHGDFTPWNMYLHRGILRVYDWEMADSAMPIGYDMFHFVMQSSVLVRKLPFARIKPELNSLSEKYTSFLSGNCGVPQANWAWGFYLLRTVSMYLKKYAIQENPHEQVGWLLRAWREALGDQRTMDAA